jgi:prepilin-type N-terminal cleavage/methylation domain-containing protein
MKMNGQKGFTLVETLAAITLITVAIVAPMALTVQSLQVAFYARDQITASNLAQEGIEAIRSLRDGNILLSSKQTAPGTPLFLGIPSDGSTFIVDATARPSPTIASCSNSPCKALNTDGQLYRYQTGTGWTPTNFTRTMSVTVVRSDASGAQEIRVVSKVTWQTAAYKSESISLSENLYNWIIAGAAAG